MSPYHGPRARADGVRTWKIAIDKIPVPPARARGPWYGSGVFAFAFRIVHPAMFQRCDVAQASQPLTGRSHTPGSDSASHAGRSRRSGSATAGAAGGS